MWMTPYGYTKTRPNDYDDLIRVGGKAVSALKAVHGTEYRLGTIANVIYKASGSTVDWVYDKGGVKYSYALELRPTWADGNGFMLPVNKIKPTVEETWVAIKAMADEIDKGGKARRFLF